MEPNSQYTVKQAIEEFYEKHDFGEDGGMHEKYAWIKFGFFSVPIPNTESRRNNVYLHDLSHIVTGYDTTWKGESAVSAWEVASGGWKNLYIPWLLTLWAMGLGVLFYSKNTYQAFLKGVDMNNGLTCGLSKDEIFKLTVSDFKNILSNKPKRNTNPFFWMAISFLIFLSPFVIAFLFIIILINILK